MNHTSPNSVLSVLRPRSFGGVIRRGALTAAAVTTALLSFGADASAQSTELPVNALAPFITREADQAIGAYDEYMASGELTDYLDYAALRTATARLAAKQLGYNEFAMIDAWKSTSLEHQRAVLAAMTQLGVPYKRYTSSEDVNFDCSGLTLYAWQSAGVALNRVSRDQIRAATKIDREDAKAGDLLHYPGHVMMYLGVDDAIVQALQTGRTVEIGTLSKRTAKRVTFGDPFESGSDPAWDLIWGRLRASDETAAIR